jgi:hypothetical protein
MHEKGKNDDSKRICSETPGSVHHSYEVGATRPDSGSLQGGSAFSLHGAYLPNSHRCAATRIETGAETADEEKGKEKTSASIAISEVDPPLLPYVMMSALKYPPTCSNVYFALEESGLVAYRRRQARHFKGTLAT